MEQAALGSRRKNRWVDISKRLAIDDLDEVTRESLPSMIRSIRNFDIEPPIFIYPPEYVQFTKRLGMNQMEHNAESYRCIEAKQLNVELKDTCHSITILQGGKRKRSDVGLGVFAVREILAGFKFPVWGPVGRPSEFKQTTMNASDRKCDIRFYLGGRSERFIILMHRECIAGYINDCSDPYSKRDSNCKLISMYPYFNRVDAHFYTYVETTKTIQRGDQLLMSYGKDFWQ